MPVTIPTVAYDGTTPDPVEWANDHVKPAIEELQAGGTGVTGSVLFVGTVQNSTIPATSFSTVGVNQVTNIGGGTWNAGTSVFTLPSGGVYLCMATLRLDDTAAERSVGIAIGESNVDAPHMLWHVLGSPTGTPGDKYSRAGRQYSRLDRFTTGAQLRLYMYSDGLNFGPWSANPGSLTIIKLAD